MCLCETLRRQPRRNLVVGELRGFAGNSWSDAPSFGHPRSRTNGYPPTLGNSDLLNLVSFFTFSTIPLLPFFLSSLVKRTSITFSYLLRTDRHSFVHSFIHSLLHFASFGLAPIFLSKVYNFIELTGHPFTVESHIFTDFFGSLRRKRYIRLTPTLSP